MRWLYAVAMMAGSFGCRSSDPGPTTQLLAYAGDTAVEAGTTIMSHRADGTVIDVQATDGAGRGVLSTEPGAYVTVLYIRQGTTQMITAPALAAGVLPIHGPPATRASIIAGSLVTTAVPIAADAYSIDMGCLALPETALPMYADINAYCLGNDPDLDVVVKATNAGALAGYFATRVRIADEVGMLDIEAWTQTPVAIPLQNDPGATVTFLEVADTFAFATPTPTPDAVFGWDGLRADSSRVRATLGSAQTTQYLAGIPTSIAITADEFLAAPTTALTFDGASGFAWTAFGIGDVTDLHATWGTTTWDAVLDPTTAAIAIPQLDANLGAPGADLSTTLRAIDGPDTFNFADVQALGIYVEATATASIVPPPTLGDVREEIVTGFH